MGAGRSNRLIKVKEHEEPFVQDHQVIINSHPSLSVLPFRSEQFSLNPSANNLLCFANALENRSQTAEPLQRWSQENIRQAQPFDRNSLCSSFQRPLHTELWLNQTRSLIKLNKLNCGSEIVQIISTGWSTTTTVSQRRTDDPPWIRFTLLKVIEVEQIFSGVYLGFSSFFSVISPTLIQQLHNSVNHHR